MTPPFVRSVLGLACLLAGLGCASTEAEPSPPPREPVATGVLTVENTTSQSVFSLRFSAPGEGWGNDLLAGGEVLGRGARRSWELPVSHYAVQAQLGDGRLVGGDERYAVPPGGEVVCVLTREGAEPTGTLTLVNETGYAIAQVSFTMASRMGWGPDRLEPSEVLRPGASRSWQVPPGAYNLRIQFQDGTALEGGSAYEVVAGEERSYRLKN